MERAPHILIADDDQQIRTGLARFLSGQGMRVTQAANGGEVFRTFDVANIDLLILDVMMPGEDGFAICRKLRSRSNVPIVLLTAVAGDSDRIVGLELGADDYVCKPFLPRELLARLKGILRRANSMPAQHAAREEVYTFNGWRLDVANRLLTTPAGASVDLTTGEFELLQAFVERPQVVLSRDQLLDLARGRALAPFDRSIDVQVMRLRRKVEVDPQLPQVIKTVRNRGYIFTPNVVSITSPGRA
ncbi:MAG: response regulator [Hyphomicrobiales bacterium]|nr:MAG: response regulator [Hyphomicrobiales bacterium]